MYKKNRKRPTSDNGNIQKLSHQKQQESRWYCVSMCC